MATLSLFLSLGTIIAAALPLVLRVRSRSFDVLEPIVGGTVMLALLFGVRPIAMIVTSDFEYRGMDITATFPHAVALGFLGTVAFVAAYEWVLRRRSRHVVLDEGWRQIRGRTAYAVIVTLALLSLLLFGLHLSTLGSDVFDGFRLMVGGQSPELVDRWVNTTEYLSTSPILAACAATLLGIATRWRMTRIQLLLFGLLIAYPTAVFYLSGVRRYMLPCLLVPLAVWLLMTARRPSARLLIALVPLAFLVLATIPFVRWASTRDASAGGVAAAFVQALQNPGQAVHGFILGPDTNMLPAVALEIGVLRSPDDFYYGRATIGDLLLAPIPRLIYPEKPQTARDDLLERLFGAPCQFAGGGVCDDFSIVGTFYQDFWMPGVAVLMAAVGGASAFLWAEWLRGRSDARLVIATATWVVFVPIIFRAGFNPGFQWWLYFFVPCILGVIAMTGPARRERPSSDASHGIELEKTVKGLRPGPAE